MWASALLTIILAAAASACSTYYVAQVNSEAGPEPAAGGISHCLRQLGFQPYTQHPSPELRQSFASQTTSGIPAHWYAERLHAGISRNDEGLSVRIVATVTYDEIAKEAATAMEACLSRNAPHLTCTVHPKTIIDFR